MISVSVRGDAKKLTRHLDAQQKKVIPLATASALNKTMRQVKTASGRAVASAARIKVGEVARKLVFRRQDQARAFGKFRQLVANMLFIMRPVAVINLLTDKALGKARTSTHGVRAAGRHWPQAFIAEGNAGNTHVFQRKGRERYPIEPVKIPLEPHRGEVDRTFNVTGAAIFRKVLGQELKYRLERLRR